MLSETRETIVTQLQHALEARVEIERAVGVVMALENLDASAAFERLRRVARASRQRVREVSRQVVEYRKID